MRNAAAVLLLILSISAAASITYQQDGSPLLTNGTNTTAATNLNADDSNYYNVTAATVPGPITQMLTNANFSTDDSGWVKTIGASSTIAWYNSGQTGGSENITIAGSGVNTNNYIAQNVTALTMPYNVTINWCYRVTRWSSGTASYLSVYLRSPGGSGLGTLLDNVSITGTGAWTCRSNSSISSTVLNSSGTYQFTAQAHLQTTGGGGGKYVSVLLDDFQLNFTPANYTLNVTHNSTANVTVPTNYTLQNVTAYTHLKTNLTAVDYTLYWFYNGAFTNTGCNATTHLSGTDADLVCSATSNPSLAISDSAIALRLFANESNSAFLTSENFINYTIRFPNMTSASIIPSTGQNLGGGASFTVNCSATADSDYAVTGAEFHLQWRNVSAGPSFSDMTASGSNGLYLSGSTPTNPTAGVSVPAGGSNSSNWTVMTNNTNGTYEIRCFVNSTTGGYQISSATSVNVTASIITLTLLQPTSTTTTDPFTPFLQNCNASCSGFQCDSVNIYAQYSSDSGTNYYDMTPITKLNTSSTQPQACGSIVAGGSCNKTFTAAGKTPGTYKIRCRSTSSNAANATSATPAFNIIANAYVETSISPSSIAFGAVDPTMNYSTSTNNPMILTVTSNTNVNVDVYLNATHLTNASSTIGVGNMTVSKTAGGMKTALTLVFPGTPYYGNLAPGATANFYFYLTVPGGQDAGDYAGAVTLRTVQTGTLP